MDKLPVKLSYFKTFKHHILFFIEKGVITKEQGDAMMEFMDHKSVKFISMVTIIGAVLTGLGILLYIASNWDHLSEVVKILLILLGMIGFFATGIRMGPDYKNTGKALIYISILIFGGGLFLIDQMFNLNIAAKNHVLLLILGVLPMAYLLKDYLIFLFIQALCIFYVWLTFFEVRWYEIGEFSTTMIISSLLLVILLKINESYMKSKLSVFINHIIMMAVLLCFMGWFEVNPYYQVVLIFGFGFYVLYTPLLGKFAGNLNRIQGIIIIGVTGVVLTYENIWEELTYIEDGTWFAICFGILIGIFMFWLTRQGNITSLVFICALILRYYTDTFYDFLPKSIFFIIGGLVLIVFGFYLERLTRVKGGQIDV